MPAFLAQMAVTFGGIAVNMLGQLMTERFMKRMTIHGLQTLAKRFPSPDHDKLVVDIAQAWGVEL